MDHSETEVIQRAPYKRVFSRRTTLAAAPNPTMVPIPVRTKTVQLALAVEPGKLNYPAQSSVIWSTRLSDTSVAHKEPPPAPVRLSCFLF